MPVIIRKQRRTARVAIGLAIHAGCLVAAGWLSLHSCRSSAERQFRLRRLALVRRIRFS